MSKKSNPVNWVILVIAFIAVVLGFSSRMFSSRPAMKTGVPHAQSTEGQNGERSIIQTPSPDSSESAVFASDPSALKTFTFRIPGEPETLDWNKAHTPIETHLLMNLMEGLVSFDPSLKITPALAKTWEVSPDGRTYVFHLRPDVKWSDGVLLKAQDFVYSWKRLLSPLTAASYAYLLFDIEGAEFYNKGAITDFNQVGISAPDELTLKVKLIRPVAHWIQIPTFWVTFPLREDLVEKYGTAWEKPGRMVTLGPYTLSAYDVDSRVVLRANPNYYSKRGNIEQVVALIIKEDATALTLFETGRLDFLTDLATLDAGRLSTRPDFKTFPYLKTGYLGFSVQNFPVSNPDFRKAIAQAIDKKKIVEILHGGQHIATSFIPPGMMGYDPKQGLGFSPYEAMKSLKASGLDPSKPVKLELLLPNWEKSLVLAQFLQQDLKTHLGLNITLQPFDHKTFRAYLDLKSYPLFEGSWAADFPDPDNFLSIFLSQSGNNRFGWKNEKYDEWVLSARNTMDSKSRAQIYAQAQKLLLEDQAVIIPLYYEPNQGLIKPRVHGLMLNPLNYLYLRDVNVD